MVSAVRVPPRTASTTPLSNPQGMPPRQTAFMHRDSFERMATPASQQRQRNVFYALGDTVTGVVLCPVRCMTSWVTLILCCPCLTASACCVGD